MAPPAGAADTLPPETPWLTLTSDERGRVLRLSGAWRLAHLVPIEGALAGVAGVPAVVDGSALTELDSAAGLVLLRALGEAEPGFIGFAPAHARILAALRARRIEPLPAPERRSNPLSRLGRRGVDVGALLLGHLQFFGRLMAAFGELLRAPRRLRMRELVVQIEQSGLDAVPVVMLVSALIGVVFTYLLGLQAEKYGANIFVVDGVGIGATRELVPIIVAVIVAGRSGAAFAAQLGAMRLAEEIDAIRTLGLSPDQVLVVPRVLALMLVLPLLVFAGDAAALAGSLAIARPMLDLGPTAFLTRLREALELRHVLIGLGKAPVFALAIALIGTRMGMTVGRDTRAVGLATTSTVVQAIVAVIVLDAIAAVLLQGLDW
ncbi:ABC transporter permease [Aquincola sp. S2]|uniref:ABC transporter permease n=1 Tax=Pseudaquabacterium terrae TaxID=2732868 RepID=A0ABX2EAX8_9BURK|nr:ABC transporter permease [Aquabacterium terrae]NRF65666.1 ABC transporter permease [Aquabacterium terrae]